MKNVNNSQITKVHLQGAALAVAWFFCRFDPGVAYKYVAYKKIVAMQNFHTPLSPYDQTQIDIN